MLTRYELEIKIGGRPLDTEIHNQLLQCVVDQSLYIPNMFSLRFNDPELRFVDDSTFAIGKELEITVSIKGEFGEKKAPLIKGEITGIEPNFAAGGGSKLVIRGYDKSWRAYRGTQQRSFANQPDSDVYQKIIGETGLSPSIDSTTPTYDYLAQDNQSSGEFLLERSFRTGLKVETSGGQLKVKKPTESSETITLKFGEALINFEPRASAAHQVNKVTVKGWDPAQKKEISGVASSSKVVPSIKFKSGTQSIGDFPNAEITIVDQPVVNAQEAKNLAQGHLDRLNSSFIQAEGVALEHPDILPGKKVKLENIGTNFSGDYLVSSAVHVYDEGMFKTTFTVTGLYTNTFAELIQKQEPMRRWPGVYPAVVTNNNDPDNMGRVKVKYPWFGEVESDWARIATFDAGPDRGSFWLPEINDEVLVAFEHGDFNTAYIIGRLWNGEDASPIKTSDALDSGQKVNKRMIRSRTGHIILLDDTDGNELIEISTQGAPGGKGVSIKMEDKSQVLTVDSANGKVKVTMDGSKNTMDIEALKDIKINSKANIKIESTGDMTLNAGKNLNLEAKLNASIKGLQLAAEGKTKTEVKGLTVSIQGSTLTEIKGALVKIN